MPIFGESYDLKAHVEIFDEFSAHADRDALMKWITKCKSCWRKVFVVHGEETASLEFAQTLRDTGISEVIVPELNQSFVL
ncbi:MAG TPA: hypothetical protein DCX22_02880 [Dehalococcoidia bacterium]|nr:hypothetical protein [Dehalococcoidia bacterium]